VRLDSDQQNCGGCGNACDAGTVCAQSQCGTTCTAPLDGCDAGLCIDTLHDPDHCGGCGIVCPAVSNAPRICSFGSCNRAACTTGFADCDTLLGDGCEVNLKTDVANCGSCGMACGGAQVCDAGTCQ
jgi:hypothetical protein